MYTKVGPCAVANSDCLAGLKRLPDKYVDAVITDPPYGMGYQSNRSKTNKKKKIANDGTIWSDWLSDTVRVLKDDSPFLMFCDWKTHMRWHDLLKEQNLNIKSLIVWDRATHGMGDLKGEFAPCYDFAWFATKGRFTFPGKRPKNIIKAQRVPSTYHPTEKPQELMQYLITHLTKPNDIVLDPFLGVGNTAEACAILNRRCVGFEIEQDYFKTILERLEKHA